MEYWKLFSDPALWKNLTGSEFGNGFAAGLALALVWILLLIVLRGIIAFIFRTRRGSIRPTASDWAEARTKSSDARLR